MQRCGDGAPPPPSAACRRALAANINRFVDKNGRISSFTPPPGAQPVHYLRGMLLGERAGAVPVQVGGGALGPPSRPPSHSTPLLLLPCCCVQGSPQFVSQKLSRGEYPPPLQHMLQGPGGALPAGGQQLLLRSLSSSRLPYPALLLGRNAWTAVDLLYTLPGVPMTFGDERTGKAYRVDVTGTYAHNTTYLDNERKKREQRFAGQVCAVRSASPAGGALESTSLRASARLPASCCQKRVQRVRTPAGHAGGAALVPLPAAGNAAALPPLPPSSSSSGRSSQQQLSSDNSKAPPQSNPARPSDAQVRRSGSNSVLPQPPCLHGVRRHNGSCEYDAYLPMPPVIGHRRDVCLHGAHPAAAVAAAATTSSCQRGTSLDGRLDAWCGSCDAPSCN